MAEAIALPPESVDSRRHEVLRAVAGLIARHGIDGMSMRQVADASGMSTGTINYYFRNKRGLIMAAIDYVYSVPPDWGGFEGVGAIEQLRTRASIALVSNENVRQWGRFWLEYAAYAGRDAELLASHERRYEMRHRVFLETIAGGQGAGQVRAGIDPVEATETLLALIDGVITQQIAFGLSAQRAAQIMFSYIDTLAAGSN